MTKPLFHLSAISTAGSFTDCILFCQKGLEALGYPTTTQPYVVWSHAINIVFCSQMLTWREISATGANEVIVYNWEPVAPDIGRFPSTYIRQMQHAHVWDYNQQNVALLKNAGVQDIHYVPMGYVPEMQRVVAVERQDIDVLFYGYINERRQKVIDAIRAKGLNVVTSDDVGYMTEAVRDAYIARAKVVLNIHFFDHAHVFEVARVAYLLANRKAVVAEVSPLTHIEPDFYDAIAAGDLDALPQLCWDLVQDDARRHELEQRAFDVFSKRNATTIMKTAVDRYFAQKDAKPSLLGNSKDYTIPLPRILQLRAGYSWRYDYCNIDRHADFSPDLDLNIEQDLPMNQTLKSWRFGDVQIKAGMFQSILAGDWFSGVDDFRRALSNCLTLLEEGGELHITAPLDLSFESWSLIDYKRAFNEKTWERIVADWWQYGWQTHRFQIVNVGYQINNPHGMGIINEQNGSWDKAMTVPRAIDVQNLVLRKCALTDDERKQLPQARFMD